MVKTATLTFLAGGGWRGGGWLEELELRPSLSFCLGLCKRKKEREKYDYGHYVYSSSHCLRTHSTQTKSLGVFVNDTVCEEGVANPNVAWSEKKTCIDTFIHLCQEKYVIIHTSTDFGTVSQIFGRLHLSGDILGTKKCEPAQGVRVRTFREKT